MKKKRITIDELAIMVKRGFDETAKKVDMEARFAETATKEDIAALQADIVRLEKEIAELRQDIAQINRLPSVLVHRVDRMEDDIRLIKTKVGMR